MDILELKKNTKTGWKIFKIPVAPYYVFNLNGASTLAAVTHTFTIIQ